jgi:hypothetical protein
VPYVANTTAVFVNGKMYRRDWDDGWLETSPSHGVVELKEAPLPGDVVQIFFTDTASPQPEEEVTIISGCLVEVDQFRGKLSEAEMRLGRVYELDGLDGRLVNHQLVLGLLKDTEILRAQLHEVCS